MSDALDDDNNSTRGVELPELIQRAIRAAFAEWCHSGIPARVERYDSTKQQVDVKVLVKDYYRDETGALVVQSVPVITNVPVGFFSSSGGAYQITGPISVGDIGALQFAERSLDAWLTSGGQEVDPRSYTRFNLADGLRWAPGGLPFGAPLANVPTNVMLLGKGAAERVEIGGGKVAVGGAAGGCKPLVLNGDNCHRTGAMLTWMGNVETALSSLSAPIPTFGGTTIATSDASATIAVGK